MVIKDLDKSIRPRERLVSEGIDKLSDSELIALILCSGTKKQNVLELSQALLSFYGGLEGLYKASQFDLENNNGIKLVKASKLLACFEISRRLEEKKCLSLDLKDKSNLFALIKNDYQNESLEKFSCIFLDKNFNYISKRIYGYGSDRYSCIPKDIVLSDAVKYRAKIVVLFHNHPSGDTTPSNNDIESTFDLSMSLKLIDKVLYDHIIVSNNKFTSMRENGNIKSSTMYAKNILKNFP